MFVIAVDTFVLVLMDTQSQELFSFKREKYSSVHIVVTSQ